MSMNRTLMRMSGLSSGMDTQQVVTDLMKLERMKADKTWKSMTQQEWKKTAYNDVTKSIRDFRNKFMTVLNQQANMMSSMNFKAKTVTTSSTSGAVTFSAGGDAALGTRSVEVQQLATSASSKSGQLSFLNAGDALDTSMTLSDLDAKLGGTLLGGASSATLDISGVVKGESKSASITLTGDMTVKDMLAQVNSANVGVTMSYSSLERRFSMTATESGAGNDFTVSTSSSFLSQMSTVQAGQNAKVAFFDANGAQIGDVVESKSNSVNVDGVTLRLNKVTNGEKVSYTVGKDTDSTVKMVKDFIEGYNALVDSLNTKLREKVNRSYLPLTDDERGALSDKQADDWDNLAKSGMLRGDSTISAFLTEMRGHFYSAVGGTGSSMSSIGITTTSDYTSGGKIQMDEAKFREALESDPEKVANMFASSVEGKKGLSIRISDSFNALTKRIDGTDIANVDRKVRDYKDRIEKMEVAMAAKEEAYYRKFTAMETMMSKMNSQSSQLFSALSGLG